MQVDKENMRLDQYLAEKLGVSRSKVQKWIQSGNVLVNGTVRSSSYLTKLQDEIEVSEVEEEGIDLVPEDIPLDIVYEDEDLLVVNKKSGMVVHPANGNYHGTLVNALLWKFQLSKGSSSIRPGIVHRIDKDTSGLLVVAKNDKTHELLSQMIRNKEIERTYIALVDGVIPHKTGTIEVPIGRDLENRQKMAVTDVHGKDSRTHFTVLKRYSDKTLIECKLDTGRTHQIRVSMKYIGYPIYNDPVYGKRQHTTEFGQFLHSWKMHFIHPITKKEISLEAPLPEEFIRLLKELDDERK